MTFHQPSIWLLFLLLLTPLVWWRWISPRRRGVMVFSSLAAAHRAGITWAVRARWVIPALRTLAVVLLVVCIARPQKPNEESRVYTEGIAIELIVDRSGTMAALDFEVEDERVDRLEAVKAVAHDFVTGNEQLNGRPDDLVGLITFARYADSLCPLTLDHGHLVDVIDETEIVSEREEDGTAIGDAIALGVERLRDLEKRADISGRHKIKSKIMILLTDGESNAGELDPLTAAGLAAAFDIKVYTIGAGSRNAYAPIITTDVFGRKIQQNIPVSIDEETLRAIAKETGGEYFRATDTESLEKIYARIDELEKTTIEQRRYLQYGEAAVESVRLGGVRLPPLLVVVVVLVALELLLSSTRLRVVP
jgi:Ca-activated chloride channel family protein